jgi:L-alanine-DL-glutamate epimerase-like enolase superfamily enzyme
MPAVASVASAVGSGSKLKVTDVEMLQLTGKNGRKALYLKISTDEGVEELYGPVDTEAAVFVDRFFRSRLIGQDPLAGEAFWDRMFRASRHSRGSHFLMGLSALDNALWDLRGKAAGMPVYRLLGGDRDKVRAYASCLGFSQEESELQAKAKQLKQEGYRHQKWFVRDRGPKFGPSGVEKDVEVVRLLLERGASVKRRNEQGQTARQLAERGSWKEVLTALDEGATSKRGLLNLF